MFEWYTESARRVIFFARYECSQDGSKQIDTDHLLLGLSRESSHAGNQLFRLHESNEQIRQWVEKRKTAKSFSTSVDLPLSNESKRVLAYTAEEAARLSHRQIGPQHLVLGILRENNSTAKHLEKLGISLDTARGIVSSSSVVEGGPDAETQSFIGSLARPSEVAAEKLNFLQRYAILFILAALVLGIIIGLNLRG